MYVVLLLNRKQIINTADHVKPSHNSIFCILSIDIILQSGGTNVFSNSCFTRRNSSAVEPELLIWKYKDMFIKYCAIKKYLHTRHKLQCLFPITLKHMLVFTSKRSFR